MEVEAIDWAQVGENRMIGWIRAEDQKEVNAADSQLEGMKEDDWRLLAGVKRNLKFTILGIDC
jgi:hypothetical protein